MERREFLVHAGQTILAIPLMLTVVSCGKDEGGSPTGPNTPTGFDLSNDADGTGHVHSIFFACANLSAGTLTYTSNRTGAGPHSHSITLMPDELNRIVGGESVTKPSSVDAGHLHNWTIQKPANVCV